MSIFGNMQQPGQGMFGAISNVGNAINPYSNRLMMAGLGMLGGNTPQEGFQGAMQGLAAGSQMDQSAADRKKELKRLEALHKSLAAGDFGQQSPTMQAYMENNPELASSVAADRLKPKSSEYASAGNGIIFNRATGEPKNIGDGGQLFSGSSVEGQALNNLVKSGQLSADQANQLGAGKVVTNPADGSLIFMTPQGIFKKPGGQDGAQQPGPMSDQQGGLPPGMTQLTPGKPNKAKSQGQVKGEVLIANAEGDYQQANKLFDALTNTKDLAKSYGGSLGQYFQSPDFQVASDSVKNVVQSYIYAVSGAQAPETEVARMMGLVMPSIIDSPERKAAKKKRLDGMMEAIRTAAREGDGPPKQDGIGNLTPAGDGSFNWTPTQ